MVGGAIADPTATSEPSVNDFRARGSSVDWLLSSAPNSVCDVVTVAVK
jgi:hypothetical protein